MLNDTLHYVSADFGCCFSVSWICGVLCIKHIYYTYIPCLYIIRSLLLRRAIFILSNVVTAMHRQNRWKDRIYICREPVFSSAVNCDRSFLFVVLFYFLFFFVLLLLIFPLLFIAVYYVSSIPLTLPNKWIKSLQAHEMNETEWNT